MLRLPSWYQGILESVLGVSIDDSVQIQRLSASVTELSKRFTLREHELSDNKYTVDEGARSAYLVYYSTVNLLKLYSPLSELLPTGIFSRPSLRVLDLGSGPGTGLLGMAGLLDFLGFQGTLHYTAVDHESGNLRYVDKIAGNIRPHVDFTIEVETRCGDFRLSDVQLGSGYDLVLAMNSLNEIASEDSNRILHDAIIPSMSSTGYLLIIEPALRNTSRELLQLRDGLTQSGWTILSPCTRQGSCPALDKETDWCHSSKAWQRPTFIERIDKAAGLIKEELKYSYILANRHDVDAKQQHSGPNDLYRAVSERFDEKGRTRLILCGENGRTFWMRNKRDKTPRNKNFGSIARYDLLEIGGEEIREHDVLVRPDTEVKILNTPFTD